ncbi:protein of unknown function [Candidatus Filomicrobium marinum]|uniref:Uncharacterized protein n=1 Tax=Candidatus Filomicrobium marinum TaxID=1608628 RepID=A0A0D6JEK7_9HYPH|nr:protein of unknown function [Candidatus Filomicrobium marinum]CPR18706.1 protein of unknown function [Candidatus Filomicrobium marinum]
MTAQAKGAIRLVLITDVPSHMNEYYANVIAVKLYR